MCRVLARSTRQNILYLEPKHTFEEFEMIRNKHQEDSTDGKEEDNQLRSDDLSFELQEGLNILKVFLNTRKTKPRYRTPQTRYNMDSLVSTVLLFKLFRGYSKNVCVLKDGQQHGLAR